jgi:hypothetical protein
METFKTRLRALMAERGIRSIDDLMQRMAATGLKVPSRKTVDKYISNPKEFHDFTRGLCAALSISPDALDEMID